VNDTIVYVCSLHFLFGNVCTFNHVHIGVGVFMQFQCCVCWILYIKKLDTTTTTNHIHNNNNNNNNNAMELVSEIGRRLTEVSHEPRSTLFLRQQLAVAVQRGNASCIIGTLKIDHHVK